MYKSVFILVLLATASFAQTKDKKSKTAASQIHYVCNLSNDVYHDKESCALLQMCRGGRYRRVNDLAKFSPCKKCVKHTAPKASGDVVFADIKRVLGVKNKTQISDSLGTDEALISRPDGVTLRITGPPESKRVNTMEFYLKSAVVFNEDSLFSQKFYTKLGLQFKGCRADTIRNSTPHPVTGKIKKDVSIEYRGCAIVEPADSYEDTSKYYYELVFLTRQGDGQTILLDKVQLLLRIDRE